MFVQCQKKQKKQNTVNLHIKYLKCNQINGGQCKTALLKKGH